jgi:hypothetical protein
VRLRPFQQRDFRRTQFRPEKTVVEPLSLFERRLQMVGLPVQGPPIATVPKPALASSMDSSYVFVHPGAAMNGVVHDLAVHLASVVDAQRQNCAGLCRCRGGAHGRVLSSQD